MTHDNGVRNFALNLARRVTFCGWCQEALIVPFFPLNTEAHDVASVEIEFGAVVPPDIDLFVLVTAQVSGEENTDC